MRWPATSTDARRLMADGLADRDLGRRRLRRLGVVITWQRTVARLK
jgi:hypothetical protein